MKKMLKKAVFIDRDGVLNKKPNHHDYVKNLKEFEWNPRAMQLVRQIHTKKFIVVVVSNQQGIALGKMSKAFVEDLHDKMNEDLKKKGISAIFFYFCEHHQNDKCDCRKPAPGLFYLAANELGIDLKKSYMIGDSMTDMEAAQKAGCRKAILIKSDTIDLASILKQITEESLVNY